MWLYTKGEVRQVSHKKWQGKGGDTVHSFEADVLETTSPTNPGDSGGPLVDDFGRLVGVTQGFNAAARGFSLFIDIGEVHKLLKDQGIEEESAGSGDAGRPDNPAAEDLAKGLNSGEARTRAQAAARLADLGPEAKPVLHQLIRALEDRDRNVRKQAGNALLQTGLPERGDIQRSDLSPLRACLRDETAAGEMQRWAMKALMALGEDAKPAVAEIGALVKSDDKETRLAAVIALEKFGPVARAILTDAAKALKSDDRMYNGRLAMALVKLDLEMKTEEGKTAVHVLIGLQKPAGADDLENKGLIAVAGDAAKALTNLGKPVLPQVRKAMMTTYRGGSLTVEEELFRATARIAMIRVLEGMGDKAAAADGDLAALEARDPVVQVRVAAGNARPKIRR
jgi:HEAT repeat protein